jgi:hypothetical protein
MRLRNVIVDLFRHKRNKIHQLAAECFRGIFILEGDAEASPEVAESFRQEASCGFEKMQDSADNTRGFDAKHGAHSTFPNEWTTTWLYVRLVKNVSRKLSHIGMSDRFRFVCCDSHVFCCTGITSIKCVKGQVTISNPVLLSFIESVVSNAICKNLVLCAHDAMCWVF